MYKVTGMVIILAMIFLPGCAKQKYPPSEVIFEDVYYFEGMENMEFDFRADSTLTVSQKGIYELKENGEGDPVVRICLDDISRELPDDYNFTEYLAHREGGHIILTFTSEEFSLDTNPMKLTPLSGKDGLLSGKQFDGTYQIGEDGDSYQYIFKEDGTVVLQVKEYYDARKDGNITLADHAGRTKYVYEASGDTLVIKNRKGEPVLNLVKKAGVD